MAAQPQLFSVEDIWDAQGELVPWVRVPITNDFPLVESIRKSPWKVVDVETTGLTPASEPVSVTKKALRQGDDPELRLRIVSVLWPDQGKIQKASFDLDVFRASAPQWVEPVCEAALTNVLIAHNAGFDTYWLQEHSKQEPTRILDTMLIGRILRPKLPAEQIKLAGIALKKEEDLTPAEQAVPAEVVQHLLAMLQGDKSGWALGDVAAALLYTVMPKELQKPGNWVHFYLGPNHYRYALDDVIRTYQILGVFLGLIPKGLAAGEFLDELPILEAYEKACQEHPEMARQEVQVKDLLPLRRKGVPVDHGQIHRFVEAQKQEVQAMAKQMVDLEPSLQDFFADLAGWDNGITAALKDALGNIFIRHGLDVQQTDKTGSFKIGEKDLRLVGAENSESVKELYNAWVHLNKAKKTGQMAWDLIGFSERSADGRLHPLLGHGPGTGRLSSSEPNSQQFPALADFRAIVRNTRRQGNGDPAYKICAVDYSALDMRVGAALAIRAQRDIRKASETGELHGKPLDGKLLALLRSIDAAEQADLQGGSGTEVPWAEGKAHQQAALLTLQSRYQARLLSLEKSLTEHMATLPDLQSREEKNRFWDLRRTLQSSIQVGRFACRLVEIRIRGLKAGTSDWSALRDTFNLGVDVHTATALRMQGQDPNVVFAGLKGDAFEKAQKEAKHKLGDHRKAGKVANLGLLYYMQAKGFQAYAARGFNIHWTLEEATAIRESWLNNHPEIDLWALWTALNPVGVVPVPDTKRFSKFRNEEVYRAETLGGRVMYPLGLNAGLAYGDQGTGADILGEVVHELRVSYPNLYDCAINQVHDEMVFELPTETAEADTETLGRVMDECANRFLMPYGVPSACTPALGDVWLKD